MFQAAAMRVLPLYCKLAMPSTRGLNNGKRAVLGKSARPKSEKCAK